jgi:protein O-mannosyl-transferase
MLDFALHPLIANMEAGAIRSNETPQAQVLRERYLLGVVLLITSVTYLGTLQFLFVYDDLHQIVLNPFIKSWRYAPQYFVGSVWKQLSPLFPVNYYRPLFLLWLRINHAAFGLGEMGWHFTSVALHVLVTFLVYRVVRKLTGRFTVAWLTALIFGLHPIHHEVVAWISGTTESLFAVMFLAAFLAYLNSLERSSSIWMAVSAVFYGLALLGKETAIVLPALVFACDWIAASSQGPRVRPEIARRLGRALVRAAVYLPVVALYLVERTRALSGLGHVFSDAPVSAWLLTLPSILMLYVKHWLFPVGLSGFYDVFYLSHLTFRGVVLPAIILVAISIAVWMLRKPLGIRDTGYSVVWAVIPLLPALDTFVFGNGELAHDRYFYVPSIGASMLVALIIERGLAGKSLVFGQPSRIVGAALALSAVLGWCAVREAGYWKDDFTLFSHGVRVAPLNSAAVNDLAAELMIRNDTDGAQALLETAYRNFPEDGRLAFSLGRLNYTQKHYAKSEKYAREAIRLDPYPADSYILLGQALLKQDRIQEAMQALRSGVELNPYDTSIHTIYGIVLRISGDCAAATSQFNDAIALNPTDAVPHLQLLGCQASLGRDPSIKSSQP